MLSLEKIIGLYSTSMTCCKGCNNHWLLTINQFGSDAALSQATKVRGVLALKRLRKRFQPV